MFKQNITWGPGTGTFTQHTFEIVIMLLGAALIGLWLGWALWNQYKRTADKMLVDNESLTATVTALRAEVEDLKSRLRSAELENSTLAGQYDQATLDNRHLQERMLDLEAEYNRLAERNHQLETELGLSFTPQPGEMPLEIDMPAAPPPPLTVEHPAAVSNPFPQTPELPELPVYEAPPVRQPEPEPPVFQAPPAYVPEPLVAPEPPMPLLELTPLPPLQPLAPKREADMPPPPASEPDTSPAAVLSGVDDLTVVEGIGPKIQELLYQENIRTYHDLAATSVDHLQDILAKAGNRYALHNPGTWPAQANLAANGEWDNLKAYQDFLSAGKRPTDFG